MDRCALFDDSQRSAFLPFAHSRPLCEMRFGMLTLREKWEKLSSASFFWLTLPYLREKFPFSESTPEWLINGRALPDPSLIERMEKMEKGEALCSGDTFLALRLRDEDPQRILGIFDEEGGNGLRKALVQRERSFDGADLLEQKWELFSRNGEALEADHELLRDGQSSLGPSSSNAVIGDRLFIGEGAMVEHATLNTETGPIHIDREAEVMEGAMIRGPFYLGPHAVVKMGARIYGPTSIGPYAKVGGEVNNSVIFGYSNKAHDGFLGNSVIGEWCNIGADTNNSNLKNNYGSVKVWDHAIGAFSDSGLTFCGIFMGDHSKCGIDTMFNTGTTIGFSANVFDAGFPPKFVPSFFWGGSRGGEAFDLDKAKEVGKKMRERRDLPFDAAEERIFDTVHERTVQEREKAD